MTIPDRWSAVHPVARYAHPVLRLQLDLMMVRELRERYVGTIQADLISIEVELIHILQETYHWTEPGKEIPDHDNPSS